MMMPMVMTEPTRSVLPAWSMKSQPIDQPRLVMKQRMWQSMKSRLL
jgi:hypothetical protein